jgi:hypothetical protein
MQSYWTLKLVVHTITVQPWTIDPIYMNEISHVETQAACAITNFLCIRLRENWLFCYTLIEDTNF